LKNGLGFWIKGDYYIGTRIMGDVLIKNEIKELSTGLVVKEYDELLIVKGDYWHASVGISYTFKKKEIACLQ
jgi:hypothetical protein